MRFVLWQGPSNPGDTMEWAKSGFVREGFIPEQYNQREASQDGKSRPEIQLACGSALHSTWSWYHYGFVSLPLWPCTLTIWLLSPFCLWFRATGSSNCMNWGCPLRQLKIQLIQQLLRLFWILQLENCVGQLTDGAYGVEGNPGVVFGPAGWAGPPPRPILHQPIHKLREGWLG